MALTKGACEMRAATAALSDEKLADLSSLAALEIEHSIASNLSSELRALFDPISNGALPIYFGPLLGRLYLEGL